AAVLFILLTIASISEISSYVFLSRHSWLLRTELPRQSVDVRKAERFYASGRFDPDLGWDERPIARNFQSDTTYFAQSYGDSFIYGDEVSGDETWQFHFQAQTGKAVANFGARGYGLDQAVLKFKKHGTDFPAKVVILGLSSQEYRRNLSY